MFKKNDEIELTGMYKKNDEIELTIEDMSVNGEGIGHANGMAFFVKGAVVGDKILAGVTKVKKNLCYARVVEIINKSPYRSIEVCLKAGPCGGCQLQALSYDKQLDLKAKQVRDCLIRIGQFSPELVDGCLEPIIGMDEPYHYRNKLQIPVGLDKKGEVVMGFYLSHSHDIVPIESCALSHPKIDALLPVIREWIVESHISIYHNGGGILRHVLIKYAFATDELMVCLIGNVNITGNSPSTRKFREKLDRLVERLSPYNIKSIVFNENCKNTNVILGERTHLIWGSETIRDYIGEVAFDISAKSFYQVNPVQTKRLYDKVMEYAALTGKEHVWDLYCGIGTIGLYLSSKVASVFGIEVVEQAIKDARSNAKLNGVDNAEYIVGKVEDIVGEIEWDAGEGVYNGTTVNRPDIVVLDPPRKGCDSACLESVLELSPERIVYVSCNPSTLARDLQILCEARYQLVKATPVDMFPQTGHVETVCLLCNHAEKATKWAHVTLTMEEYRSIKAKSEAQKKAQNNE